MNILQRKLITNAFMMSQLSYCLLIWMFHSRAMEHRINRIHERTLRLIYPNQHQLTFKELLEKKQDCQHTPEKFIKTTIIKTTILEMRQFLKGRDISQSIMEVKVLYP